MYIMLFIQTKQLHKFPQNVIIKRSETIIQLERLALVIWRFRSMVTAAPTSRI